MIALSHFSFALFSNVSKCQMPKFKSLLIWSVLLCLGVSHGFLFPPLLCLVLLFFFFVCSTFPTIVRLGGEVHSFDSSLLFLALFTFL